jgi:F-type H+-transporting ATPase subunit a
MQADKADFITPHITDSRALDLPCFKTGWVCEHDLPRWDPIHVGRFAIDISPTKHVVMLWVAALLTLTVMLIATRAHKKATASGTPAKGGLANGLEAMVLYIRQEVILPNVGHHGNGYVPFLLTIFFFILFANLLGLIPYGSTATGNISVTATLAIISFITIELAGMKTLGWGYIKTIVFWPEDMSLPLKIFITPILTPIEIFSKSTKPFALAIRLFANMTAGHVVVIALISLVFTFGSWFIAGVPVAMAVAIMILELFIAFLQAFVFTLLSAVFIGLIREGAH